MKKILSATLILSLSFNLIAQEVPQTILVEHFTNTRCGVCASRNPGFFTNLNAQSNVLHMAIHPSAPYSTCLLNQHNKIENDARTQFYGIFGSTPRLVIEGNTISASANYAATSLFSPYLNRTTPISITVNITEEGNNVNVQTVVKAVAAHTFTDLLISGFLVEENLAYAAPNGEQTHYNVFRKGIFSMSGETFTAPANGDSVVFNTTTSKNSAWNLGKMYALITIQQTNKQAVQSTRSNKLSVTTGIGLINSNMSLDAKVYPNPANNELKVELTNTEQTQVQLFNLSGKVIYEEKFSNQLTIPTGNLSDGLYVLRLNNTLGQITQKINISH
jgi:hypothetical protein